MMNNAPQSNLNQEIEEEEIDEQIAGNLVEIDNISSLKVYDVEDLKALYIKYI